MQTWLPQVKGNIFSDTININGAILKGITRRLVALQSRISRLGDALQLTKHQAHLKEQAA